LKRAKREGKAVVINESADLFEARPERGQTMLGSDLVSVLGARVQRLVERHRATQRAVSELRESVAARDRRIVELDAKLAAAERGRSELVARIDALIAEVDGLVQAAADDALSDGRER
jgi:hypothetical protein